jgi:hypothetical protein
MVVPGAFSFCYNSLLISTYHDLQKMNIAQPETSRKMYFVRVQSENKPSRVRLTARGVVLLLSRATWKLHGTPEIAYQMCREIVVAGAESMTCVMARAKCD